MVVYRKNKFTILMHVIVFNLLMHHTRHTIHRYSVERLLFQLRRLPNVPKIDQLNSIEPFAFSARSLAHTHTHAEKKWFFVFSIRNSIFIQDDESEKRKLKSTF